MLKWTNYFDTPLGSRVVIFLCSRMKNIFLNAPLSSRVVIFPCSRMKTIFLNLCFVIKAPSEIQSDMSQTSKAEGDANMTLKMRDDMIKNLKM